MNKREAMEKMWVPIHKRLPPRKSPDGSPISILVYNQTTKKWYTTDADLLHYQLEQTQTKELLDNWKGKMDPHLYHTGYYVSHWMFVYPPEGYEEMVETGREIKHCSVCGERQYATPSGPTCKNGHGGAEAKEDL